MLNIKTSMGGLEQLISRLKTANKNTLSNGIAKIVTDGILDNTSKGIDVNGVPFKPYTEKYAKYGRLAKGYNTNPVDLKRTGDMLSSITVEKSGIVTTISIADDQKAKAEGNSRYRKFMGISVATRDKLKTYVQEFVGLIIKGK